MVILSLLQLECKLGSFLYFSVIVNLFKTRCEFASHEQSLKCVWCNEKHGELSK